MSKRLASYILQLKQTLKPVPVSETGMWFQSKDVIVPSNQITMKGPDGSEDYFKEPIIGQGVQSGEVKVMQPGKEYHFPNDKQVFERRMQSGGLYAVGPYDKMMAPRQGNYLLPDINRPSYTDEFGGRRSEYRIGFSSDGKETLIPTVVQGKQLSDDEAVDNYYRTGLHMGKYDTVQDAENASALRTAKYNMFEDPIRFRMSDYVPNMQDGGTVQTNMLQPIKKDEESLPVILDSLFSQFQKTKEEFGVEPEEEGATTELQKGGFKYTPPARTPFLRTSPAGNAGYSDNARVVTPFTGMDDATRARLDAQKAEEARRKKSGVISQGTPETLYQKAKRKSSFVEQEKERTGSASPISYALDLVNPATYAFAATDLVGNTGSAVKNAAQGNFQEAGSDLIGAGMNALYLLPAISPAKSAARFATTQTPLKNTYKINPFANKLNTYNRVVGREAVDDALETGLIRAKAPSSKSSSGQGLINLDRRGTTPYASFGEGPVSSENVYAQNILDRGDTPYIISTDRTMKPSTLGSHGKGSTLFPVDESGNYLKSFPISEVQIYEAHPNWLKGYQSVEVPSIRQNFKSEIDWAKWNPDTPKYPELMNEYNAIEESTKKAGTWMKNPDGSAFKGTPEQFIQQQSSYFKKAFPNILRDSKGNILPVKHGSPNKFEEFKKEYFTSTTDIGDKGVGTYVSPLEYANQYGDNVYELAVNSKNPLYASDFIPDNIPVNARKGLADSQLKWFHRDVSPKLEGRVNRFLDNDLVIGDEFHPKINENAFEMVVPYSNRVKSLRGNVGFFDMTNPNIYKAAAPVGAGLGVGTSQLQKPKPKLQMGGTMSIPGVNGTVVASSPSLYKKYKSGGNHGGLDRWFAEKWVDVKTGEACGRSGTDKDGRPYPACRPSKRISSKTPKTSSEMSSQEKAKFKATKTSSQRIPYNHKRN